MGETIGKRTVDQIAAGYWKEINTRLPAQINEEQRIWLKNYFQAQVAIREGDFAETRKILTRLDKEEGFISFEEEYPQYFATLEVIARGKTNRDHVKPLFVREDLECA